MNINQGGNRPKLKKIKRPINRTAPIGGREGQMQGGEISSKQAASQNTPSKMQNPMRNPMQQDMQTYHQSPQYQIPDSRSLNEYLDGNAKIPEVREQNKDYQPNFVDNEEYYDEAQYSNAPAGISVKVFVASVIMFLAIGIFAGKIMFSQSTVVRNGLQGVVVNSEVPRGRARCGIAERSQGCVLYVMNPQRQEMSAKDFYDLAAQVTGRQRFMIETGNMRYANTKIKPGDIAQLNIPPL